MELNITHDEDNEQVTFLYEDYLCITARLNSSDRLVFSNNLTQLDDDPKISKLIRQVASLLLNSRS